MSKKLRITWLNCTVCDSNKIEVAFSRKIANLAMTNGYMTAIKQSASTAAPLVKLKLTA
ncbi:hypothetical protein [Photobacterium kasasachensis]|uniref:hypothetical protein n=1 Tax=Photobacterium kasasachensis TaxID=2910240 RepID=UPI003D0B8769